MIVVENNPLADQNKNDGICFTVDTHQDWSGAEEIAANKTRGISTRINEQYNIPIVTDSGRNAFLAVVPSNGIWVRQRQTLNSKYLNKLSEQAALTRSEYSETTSVSERITQSFGMFTYVFSGNWTGNETPNYWYNAEVVKDGSIWKMKEGDANNEHRKWPNSRYNIRFFAYYPYNLVATNKISSNTTQGIPYFQYTVPNDISQQKDVLVTASNVLPSDDSSVPELQFKHAMCAVRFKMDDAGFINGTINSITLTHIGNVGNCPMDGSEWNDIHGDGTYVIPVNRLSNSGSNYLKGEQLHTDGNTPLLIPQVLNGARIRLDYTKESDGSSGYIEGDLFGEWKPGKTYTYIITATGPKYTWQLDVSYEEDDIVNNVSESSRLKTKFVPFTGGQHNYYIRSVKIDEQYNETYFAPYYVTYSVDGTIFSMNKPDWIVGVETSTTGSVEPESHIVEVAPVEDALSRPKSHVEVLQETEWKGSATEPFDLSMHDIDGNPNYYGQVTANCYVVNSPGNYKIPLVYGCAIKNGEANVNSYRSSSEQPANNYYQTSNRIYLLKNFVDHNGNAIYRGGTYSDETDLNYNLDPYIWDHYTPGKAGLIWQDEPSLLQGVQLSSDKKYIEFTVNTETIKQGNAVIAVYDEAKTTIMWSWHIWVTDESLSSHVTIANKRGKRYEFMAATLGWCSKDPNAKEYDMRSCLFRIQQESGISKEMRIVQNEGRRDGAGNVAGRNTYYQHGRKDPMLPTDQHHSTWTETDYTAVDATQYNEAGGVINIWNLNGVATDIPSGIKYPYTFFKSSGGAGGADWLQTTYYNLWSANNIAIGYRNPTEVVKTIYDPSPPGYKMPIGDAFTGFTAGTSTQADIRDKSKFHVVGDWAQGWYLYSDNGSGALVFLPANGLRKQSVGEIRYLFHEGHYWCATPAEDADGGTNFCFKGPYAYANCWYMNPANGDSAENTDGWDKGHGECVRPVVDKEYEND